MSDTDATQARQDVVADVDEILEHVINANMLSMPYDVYSKLFDAVDGLGVEIENLQAENAKLRNLCADMYIYHNDDCHSCRYHQECADRIDWKCIAPIRLNERARALGIEDGK